MFQSKIDDLIAFNNSIYQSRLEFLLWFESFSEIIERVAEKYNSVKENKDDTDGTKKKFFKEEFLFRFLTLGNKSKEIFQAKVSVFIDEIIKFNNESLNEGYDTENIVDCETFIKGTFLKVYEETLKKLRNETILNEAKENLLKNFTSNDDVFQHYDSKKFNAFKQKSISNDAFFTPSIITNSTCNILFKTWLVDLLKKK